jgi:hypothetical protein
MSSPVIYFWRKIAKWRHSFLKNGTFCSKFLVFEKKIRHKATENWFFWGWCHHIYAYWLHPGYIRKLKKKTLIKPG